MNLDSNHSIASVKNLRGLVLRAREYNTVPQGSVLGPRIMMYTGDLGEKVDEHGALAQPSFNKKPSCR